MYQDLREIPTGSSPTGPLNRGGHENVAIFDQYLAISQKRLTIDGYIQRGVLQALNRVTFTAIVPGAYTGEAKMCNKCAKMANY